MEDNIFQLLTRDAAVNVGGKDVFHSQHPTKTVNLSAFSAMSGSSSFSVDSVNQQI